MVADKLKYIIIETYDRFRQSAEENGKYVSY